MKSAVEWLGFEIKKDFFTKANNWINQERTKRKEIAEFGFAKSEINKIAPTLF